MGSRLPTERGQAALMATMGLVPTLALVGFVVDVGWAHVRKMAAINAAISGATAGARAAESASNFTCGSGVTCQSPTACPSTLNTPSNPIQATCLYIKQNGFTNGGNGGTQTVKIEANTTANPVAGVSPSYWIRATVSEQIPLTFLSVLGQQFTSVSAESIGGVFGSAAGGGCIYVMNPSGIGITMSGGGISSNCGVYVNSTGANAVTQSGGSITTTGSAKTNIRGGWSHSGGTISPAPTLGAAAQSDPFASMAAPTVGACTSAGVSLSSGSTTIDPGVYCGAITLSGGTLTMNPGLYIMKAGFSISGGTVQSAAGGMTFYFESGGMSMSGGTVNLSAPTSGTWKGILAFESRTNSTAFSLSGSTQTYTGAVYAPAAAVTVSGGTFTNFTLLSKTISISGGSVGTINGGAVTQYTSATVGRIE